MKIITNFAFFLFILLLASCNIDEKKPIIQYETKIEIRYIDNTIDTITNIFYQTKKRKLPKYEIYIRDRKSILISYVDEFNYDYLAIGVKRFKILEQKQK